MKWIKKGLIYKPTGDSAWAKHSALQPTPIVLNDIIRIYIGMRDDKGVSRIGFVDVETHNPSHVIQVSEMPILDIGIDGSFDENGVVPCFALKKDDLIYLYYAGYQLGHKVRFLAFGGLAVSEDNGLSFKRVSNVPLTDRTNDELLFRVIHSIVFENGTYKAWYGGGSGFIQGKHKLLPTYNIRYMESDDCTKFSEKGTVVLDIKDDEYRVGRPFVVKIDNKYIMFYGKGSEKVPYTLAYAESNDGINWTRKDNEIGIGLSSEGWDSQMIAYPAIVQLVNKTYMFYNGNDYGKTGFGYAVLEK